MVSIAGSKKLKRQMAPQFWGITRKDKRFVTTVRPGPHAKDVAIPLAVLLRDTLKITSSARESQAAIYARKVTVDGVRRKSVHHGVGLMDVVELDGVEDIYRMVPQDGDILRPVKIDASEKSKKICKVTGKTTISGGKTQVGLHDGRSVISETEISVGDSCIIQVPEQKIEQVIKLEKGCQAIVTRGVNTGQLGTITEIKKGTFVLPKLAVIQLGERSIEIPTDNIMAVGSDKPALKIR